MDNNNNNNDNFKKFKLYAAALKMQTL